MQSNISTVLMLTALIFCSNIRLINSSGITHFNTPHTLNISTLISSNLTDIQLAHAGNTSRPILLSSDAAYAWQFFPYSNNTQRLLVILSTLYNTTVVWIANRDRPASPNASLSLHLPSRSLTLREPYGTLIWSPPVHNISSIFMNSTGNLYILASNSSNGVASVVDWQSFDVPADVFVPGQRLLTNHTATASLAWNNWASGHYTLRANPGGVVLYATFDAQQTMVPYQVFNYVNSTASLAQSLNSSCNHTTILYNPDSSGVTLEQDGPISPQCLLEDYNSVHGIDFANHIGGDGYHFLRVMPTGDINSFFLSNSTGLRLDNELFKGFYSTYCRLPSYCGVNSLCSSVQTCTCPALFNAIDPSDPTQGCRLQTPLNCTIFRQHKFLPVAGSDYFANAYLPPRETVSNPTDCTNLCLQNCSCTAAFYNNQTGACHLYDQLRTMRFGSNPLVTAFLRVASLPASDQTNGNDPLPKKVIIGVSVAAAAVLVITVGLVACISRRLMQVRRDEDSDSEEEAFLEGLPGLPPRFSYKQLYDATEGFSKQLGKGGSGEVYEGHLQFPSSAVDKVAVKQLTLSEYSKIATASKRHFRAEVATLGNLSHVNLVQLKGFCAEGLHRLIIYEFMENGSLDEWIFPNRSKAGAYVLPWEVRYRIAVDTARGLAFLHEECREKVVHLDVKPQNILLDTVFRAKLADFGLSKLMERGHTQTVTAMRGTPGYMAPEWFLNLPITDRSDVFSYGMVLLELVGGRKNLNTAASTSDEWYYPAWALKQAENGRIRDVVDKRLLPQLQYSQNISQASTDQGINPGTGLVKMERLINVAFWCIQEDATSRPSMTTVVLMLEGHLQVPDPPLEMAYMPRQAAGRRMPAFTTPNSGSHTSTAALSGSTGRGATAEIGSVLSPRYQKGMKTGYKS
ncbi:hypothetical protein GOP47_0004037 [Adiantum capillus-veneris]|uniref:Receptor-like serine/threonine-protein kinase n=1 Tax=Adiantum capillus-veneris TaxID=13818 RepID=A0A9D4V7B2_ADICA|nr:hypothetical protein GOP47_0004037 [Adiantum capillus-veneris]